MQAIVFRPDGLDRDTLQHIEQLTAEQWPLMLAGAAAQSIGFWYQEEASPAGSAA